MTVDGGGPRAQDARGPGVLTPEPDDSPPPALLASWLRRVVATLLDNAVMATIVFLAFPVQPVLAPTILPGTPRGAEVTAAVWWESGWVLAAFVVGVMMQAYLGSTVGKLAVGIAVVRERDARPAGLLWTLTRGLAHLLDGILLIGFLRPLWNRRGQTFADSLAGTVVLATRRPLPFGRRPRSDLPPHRPGTPVAPPPSTWETASVPAWRRAATTAAAAACVVAVAFQASASSTSTAPVSESCSVPASSAPLDGGEVEVATQAGTERRLGVERQRLDGPPGVVVVWPGSGDAVGESDTVLRVTFTAADGTRSLTFDHVVWGGSVQPGAGEPLTDGRAGVRFPPDVVAGLGEDWTWTVAALSGGRVLGSCGSA